MSTDLQILLQKFNNFKNYIKTVSTNTIVLKDYENMSDKEFLLFGLGFLIPNKNKLEHYRLIIIYVLSWILQTNYTKKK